MVERRGMLGTAIYYCLLWYSLINYCHVKQKEIFFKQKQFCASIRQTIAYDIIQANKKNVLIVKGNSKQFLQMVTYV